MAKFVHYNGGTEDCDKYSVPTELVAGEDYEVIHETETLYILREVTGRFNPCWFDEASPTFMAISEEIPVIGSRCICSKILWSNSKPCMIKFCTSTIKYVENLGNSIYEVRTNNSVYIIQVEIERFVRYNGGVESFSNCSEPTNLVWGKDYEVITKNKKDFQTDYILKGLNGHYNSQWFDEVSHTFMAISNKIPVVDKKCDCLKVILLNNVLALETLLTSTIKEVKELGNNIYMAKTYDGFYIIKVK